MEETKIYLGSLSQEEIDLIEPLVERLAGLEELAIIINDSKLRLKVIQEIAELRTLCDDWFIKIAYKKHWEYGFENWEIDFLQRKIWMIQS